MAEAAPTAWTLFSETSRFQGVYDLPLRAGEVEWYGENWVFVHCICGESVYLEISHEYTPTMCTCGRSYLILHIVEMKEPDERTTSPGK